MLLNATRGQRRIPRDDRLGDGTVLVGTDREPPRVRREDAKDHPVNLVAKLSHHPQDLPVSQEPPEEGMKLLVQGDAPRDVACAEILPLSLEVGLDLVNLLWAQPAGD